MSNNNNSTSPTGSNSSNSSNTTRVNHSSPNSTDITMGLPPNSIVNEENYLEIDSPNVLIDRVLGLHSKNPNTNRPGIKRDESLINILSNSNNKQYNQEEEEPLLSQDSNIGAEDGDNETDDDDSVPRIRDARSRSKSQRRKVPWYTRPSPMWFLPSTLAMSISIGMIIAPKFEIYTQLICRNIGPERSGTTLPAPSTSILDQDALRRRKSSKNNQSTNSNSPKLVLGDFENDGDGVLTFVNDAMLRSLEEENDSWSKQCRKSPAVQASVAQLATMLTLLMGVLSSLTAGYWGALSDRRGRKPILALALFGTIFMDAVFLIVVNYHDVVGYQFLLVGPLLDGLLGGMSTASAAVNAYLSDCTEAGSRARIFSILGGLLFGGVALGPTLGAVSISVTGSVMSPFYLALSLHTLYFLSVLFLFPESLSVARQLDARTRHREEIELRRQRNILEDEEASKGGGTKILEQKLKRSLEIIFGFARPLALLLPRKRGLEEKEEDKPVMESRGPVIEGWDYELTKVAMAYATYVLVIAIMGPKLMYASFKYGWGPEENGFYLSFIGCCRVFALIVAVPILIKIFKKSAPLPSSVRPGDSISSSGNAGIGGKKRLSKAQLEWENEAKYLRVVHDSHFDLFLARISIMVDILTYSLIATNGGSQIQFLVGSGLSSFGAATTAALQSLALALASPRDSGRLFASLSVLSSISSQVIGPIFFASIYIATVKTLPEMMFYFATGIFILSLSILLCVSLKRKIVDGEAEVVGRVMVNPESTGGNSGNIRGRSTTRKGSTAGDSGIVIRD